MKTIFIIILFCCIPILLILLVLFSIKKVFGIFKEEEDELSS